MRFAVTFSVLAALSACVPDSQAALPQQQTRRKGGDGRTGEYDVVANWWKSAPNHDKDWTWGQVSGLAVDNPNRILVVTRGDWHPDRPRVITSQGETRRSNFVVVADSTGKIVETWSQWDSLFTLPHQIYINPYDPERSVWVTESGGAGRHLVLKFSNDGKRLLMKLGDDDNPRTRDAARANLHPGPYQYGWPSTLAFLPNGDFLLADGYWNSRIIHYTADGKYVNEWGKLGKGPGEFDLLHGTAVDRQGRVYQGDRTNARIEIFDSNGRFMDEWDDIADPVNVYIDRNDFVWVLSATRNRIMKYDMQGHLLYWFGTFGADWPGGLSRPHQMDVDQNGVLYLANYDGGWVNKFVPKQGADPSKLVGQPLVLEKPKTN